MVILFDEQKNVVDTVWFRQLKSRDGSIVHTGDNRTGEGDGDDRPGAALAHPDELLRSWLPRLTPMGQAWLVVGKNLGADSLQRWITEELALPTERVASSKGFRVLRVTR